MRRNVEHHHGAYLVNGALVQSDWDYPRAAEWVGWSLQRVQVRNGEARHLSRRGTGKSACAHRGTDGTIDCPDCGITAGEFISAAGDYLGSLAF